MGAFFTDTITARATALGQAGVGIIRVSGPAVRDIAVSLLGFIPKPRLAVLSHFLNKEGEPIDQGIVLYFQQPHSFTGEDVLELQGHSGTIVMDMLLQRIVELGARIARPGEFSERAFLNNKLDLIQAEAIADLIEASSTQAARSAMHSLQGKFSAEIQKLVTAVIELRLYVEAAIDFPEEEIDFLSDGKILLQLQQLSAQLNLVLQQAHQGTVLKEGMKVAIIGHPNAGKSSLLNNLSGEQTAIVSDIAGTTRDILKENIFIDGMPVHLVDTAGLREATDIIEAEGVKRALDAATTADHILLVIDATSCSVADSANHKLVQQFANNEQPLTLIRNKIDLTTEAAAIQSNSCALTVISLSAKTNVGIDLLKEHLKNSSGYQSGENVYIARRRHLEALHQAKRHLALALEQLVDYQAGECVAEELRATQTALNEITGEFRSDDLLGKIFSSFCIGK